MFDLSVFLLTMQKVAFLLLVILLGYWVCHSGKIERKSAQTLSILTTHIFSPAYSLYALPKNFTVENLGSNLAVLGLSALLLLPTIFLARFFAKRLAQSDFEQKSLSYIFAFANTGYFG
jgi:predicted permease